MKKIKIMVLVVSLIITVILTYGIYEYFGGNVSEQQEVEYIELIVASEDIEVGREIKLSDTETIKIYGELNLGDYFNLHSDIVGKYAKEKILKGEGFRKARIIDDYKNKLVGKIRRGYRAVSIVTDRFDGVADLLNPGDFVDIFVFLPEKTSGEEVVHPDMTKLIVQNVEILSISKDIEKDGEVREKTPDLYAITFELNVLDVETVLLAENIGYIKIALRPINDGDIYRTYGTLWEELMLDKNNKMRNIFPEYESIESWINERTLIMDNTSAKEEVQENQEVGDIVTDYIIHAVEDGETLRGIAQEYYPDDEDMYEEIKRVNNLNDNSIITGRKLKIPVNK